MPLTVGSYCSADDVKAAVSRWSDYSSDAQTRVGAVIAWASKMVDNYTGQWFEDRSLTFKTQIHVAGQVKLFMPARIISITTLTMDGGVLAAANYVPYSTYLERARGSISPLSGTPWTGGQLNIQVAGHFGYATTPSDITAITARLTGVIMGMVNKQQVTGDSAISEVATALPMWAKDSLTSYKMMAPQYQPFVYI